MEKIEQIKEANRKVEQLKDIQYAIKQVKGHANLKSVEFPHNTLVDSTTKVQIPTTAALEVRFFIVDALENIEKQLLAEIEAIEI